MNCPMIRSLLLPLCLAFGAVGQQAGPATAEEVRPRTLEDRTLLVYVHQTRSVKSACFTPALRAVLDRIRQKVGRELIVTSGFRGPRKRRSGSYHGRCMAAEIQAKGVSPRAMRRIARSIPDVGGIGTYCHTRSVHVDVGPRRDWHWGCRKRRR